jgi:hypothetical protein
MAAEMIQETGIDFQLSSHAGPEQCCMRDVAKTITVTVSHSHGCRVSLNEAALVKVKDTT